MPTWQPWLDNQDGIILEIAGISLVLTRLNLGDSEIVGRTDKICNDLALVQSGRPTLRNKELTFGPFKKTGDTPPAWTYLKLKELHRLHPGWPCSFTYEDGTLIHGIIDEIIYSEVAKCQMNVTIRYTTLREFPQGGLLAI